MGVLGLHSLRRLGGRARLTFLALVRSARYSITVARRERRIRAYVVRNLGVGLFSH
jgi:hypothetical protein